MQRTSTRFIVRPLRPYVRSLDVGLQALRAHTGRSLLTTLGIVVGIAAVICTMSIGAGAEDEVAERLRTLGANLLIVTPGAAKPGGVRLEAGLG
jgi:hypothetical protein